MNPRPYTCRRLKLLADAKREHQYDMLISHACFISQVLNGKFNPATSNPIANERTRALQNLVGDKKGSEGFALLGAGLRLVAQGVSQ